jgi:hypothetical protein
MGELAENKEEEAIQTTHQKQNQRAFSQIQSQVANTNNNQYFTQAIPNSLG